MAIDGTGFQLIVCEEWGGGSIPRMMVLGSIESKSHGEQDNKQHPSMASTSGLASRFLAFLSSFPDFLDDGLCCRTVREINLSSPVAFGNVDPSQQ